MGKIIALTNQKGGVGKTTSTINLGACLAVAETKTLIVDLDPQGNSGISLGIDKTTYSEKNVYHALIGQVPIKETIIKTELKNLDLCPSDNNLIGAEIELVSEMAREKKLKIALADVIDDYDYILIDCQPTLGLLTINALNAADSYIVPMAAEFLPMEGLSQLLNTINLIKSSLNPEIYLEGILITMFDARNNLCKQVANEITEHFEGQVFKTFIPRNVKLSECPSYGKPIILYDIESKGSTAYFSLAKEILLKEETNIESPVISSFPEVTL